MTYYEFIKPGPLYKAHKIKRVTIITRNPVFCDSAWVKVRTVNGEMFYLNLKQLYDMLKNPKYYPTKERRWFVSVEMKEGKEATPGREPDAATA